MSGGTSTAHATPATLHDAFNDSFAPRSLSRDEVMRFAGTLLRDGLILAPGADFAQTASASRQQRQRVWLQTLANPLMIKLPGWDPDRFLRRACSRLSWVFSKWYAVLCVAVMAVAAVLVARQLTSPAAVLMQVQSLIEPENLIWLSLSLAFAKVLHEFGHAIACRRLGAECHEMGVMLLAFTPCLYCDVTDAWTLQNKWHRIMVSAAGIAVDLFLASACAIVWSCTEPGALHSACLNLMFVCSVSTVIFNANPLMRYDGYYVLQDLLEQPNLRERAREWVRHVIVHWFTGCELVPANRQPRHRFLLFAWGVASTAYLWFVIAMIVLAARRILASYQLTPLADLIALLTILRVSVLPAIQLVRRTWFAAGDSTMNWTRLASRGVLAIGALTCLVLLPLPDSIQAPAMVRPADAQNIYAGTAGTLVEVVPAGSHVSKGDVVARLADIETELAVADLRGQCRRQQARVLGLQQRQLIDDDAAGSQLSVAQERLVDLRQRLAQKERDLTALVIVAERAGVVMSAQLREETIDEGELRGPDGILTDDRNRGCLLQRETLLCSIGDPSATELVLTVDQDAVGHFTEGGSVRVSTDQQNTVHPAEVIRISRDNSEGGRAATTTNGKGLYRIQLAMSSDATWLSGDAGTVRVSVPPSSLGVRIVTYLGRTVRWPL